jgi:cyclophilin family peptidyl-prolyl cis-trans isomerase
MEKHVIVFFAVLAVIAAGMVVLMFNNGKKPTPLSEQSAYDIPLKEQNSNAPPQNQAAPPAQQTQPMSNKNIAPPLTEQDILAAKNSKTMNATIKTSLGDIKVEIYGDKTPVTAANFAKLAESGFYNGVKFHRVIKGFMIQGGDPLTKDDSQKDRWGMGGPGYQFADEEFEGQYTRGTLAMANSGPNTNGSQFFIMHQDYPLPPNYVIFGKVTQGLDVVDKIANLPTDPSNDRPLDPPVIQNITIEK